MLSAGIEPWEAKGWSGRGLLQPSTRAKMALSRLLRHWGLAWVPTELCTMVEGRCQIEVRPGTIGQVGRAQNKTHEVKVYRTSGVDRWSRVKWIEQGGTSQVGQAE